MLLIIICVVYKGKCNADFNFIREIGFIEIFILYCYIYLLKKCAIFGKGLNSLIYSDSFELMVLSLQGSEAP